MPVFFSERNASFHLMTYMDVSLNGGTHKSSILIGCSIINHPFWGTTILGNPHINDDHFATKKSPNLGPTGSGEFDRKRREIGGFDHRNRPIAGRAERLKS